jgi:hypothetical protein
MRLLAETGQIDQAPRPESAMPLWKLRPLDLSDPNWEASSHRGVVIVRAPDEETARVRREDPLQPGRAREGAALEARLACLSRADLGSAL